MQEIEKHGITIYALPDCDSDEDEFYKEKVCFFWSLMQRISGDFLIRLCRTFFRAEKLHIAHFSSNFALFKPNSRSHFLVSERHRYLEK